MRDFIDYLQEAFITASGGNTYDNSYSSLDLTSRSLLHFPTPAGSRITLSSFVRPKFGTSYSIGIKDGWVSYLYSTHPADTTTSSDRIPLPNLLRGYRSLSTAAARHAVGHALVYGRLYLPQSRLEALLAARVTRSVNLTLRAVSQETLRHGGTALALASWDDPAGRFGVEALASSDGGVLGLRGLWNATNPPARGDSTGPLPLPSTAIPVTAALSAPSAATPSNHHHHHHHHHNNNNNNNAADKERINGRFSVGGEIYYGLLNKSGGMSMGGRFQTLPTHAGTPLTAALTFNLLGHLSATYAVMAGPWCTLASQFGFNLYSYESEWAVGVELWRGGPKKRPPLLAAGPGGADGTGHIGREGAPLALEPADAPEAEAEAVLAARTGLGREIDPTLAEAMQTRAVNNQLIKTVAALAPSEPPPPPPPPLEQATKQRSFQARLEWRLDDDDAKGNPLPPETCDAPTGPKLSTTGLRPSSSPGEGEWADDGDFCPAGVVKCRCDQNMRLGLMYEGRYKSLLFSLGTDVDLKRLDAPFQGVGVAVQFSS